MLEGLNDSKIDNRGFSSVMRESMKIGPNESRLGSTLGASVKIDRIRLSSIDNQSPNS